MDTAQTSSIRFVPGRGTSLDRQIAFLQGSRRPCHRPRPAGALFALEKYNGLVGKCPMTPRLGERASVRINGMPRQTFVAFVPPRQGT